MTLFVGGTRHGTDLDDDHWLAGPSYVDPVSGESYTRVKLTLALTHPLTGQPIVGQIWDQDVYVMSVLAADPQGMAHVADAITRWWFTTHGTLREPVDGALVQQNGHADRITYIAVCQECEPVLPMPFADRATRARWMQAHIDATGHKVTWSDDPVVPTPKENGE